MSETEERNPTEQNPTRLYVLIALVLAAVIVVVGILLVTQGLPALKGDKAPTPVTQAQPTATPVPTFTPAPTRAPTATPPPTKPPTPEALIMRDTDAPLFAFQGAGARPGVEWTGFFGQVVDAVGNPLAGVSLIIWYRDGVPASDVVQTDAQGSYEIRLAEAPLAGIWTIQVLTDDGQPASKLFTFQTDEDTEKGIQQIQVLWQKVP